MLVFIEAFLLGILLEVMGYSPFNKERSPHIFWTIALLNALVMAYLTK